MRLLTYVKTYLKKASAAIAVKVKLKFNRTIYRKKLHYNS